MKILNNKTLSSITQIASLAFFALMILAASNAVAQEEEDAPYEFGSAYVGVGGGLMVHPKYCDFSADAGVRECQDSEEAFHAFLGYSFSDNFALEGGWMRTKGYKASGRFADDIALKGLRNRLWDTDMDYQTVHFGLRGSANLSSWMGITGLAGAYYWDRTVELGGDITASSATPARDVIKIMAENLASRQRLLTPNLKKTGVDFVGSAGVEFFFTQDFTTQWQWTRFVGDRYDGDLYSIDFTYEF